MIKRYIHFRAEGSGEHVRCTVEGLCDAACDPMQVAMARSHDLTRCSRVKLTVSPAFEVMVSGSRQKDRRAIEAQAQADAEALARREAAEQYERQQELMRRNRLLYGRW